MDKPIFKKPAKSYESSSKYLTDNNELLKKNKNRYLIGSTAGLDQNMGIGENQRLPSATSESLAPVKNTTVPEPVMQDPQNILDYLLNIDPDNLTPDQENLIPFIIDSMDQKKQQGLIDSGYDASGGVITPPVVTDPNITSIPDPLAQQAAQTESDKLAKDNASALSTITALAKSKPSVGVPIMENYKTGKETLVNDLEGLATASGDVLGAANATNQSGQAYLEVLQREADALQKELEEKQAALNDPKVKSAGIALANMKSGNGYVDPTYQPDNFTIPDWKAPAPTTGEVVGEALDTLGTKINAPELGLSELFAKKNTKNTGKKAPLFASPSKASGFNPLNIGSAVVSAFKPAPVFAADDIAQAPDVAISGAGGGNGQSNPAPAPAPSRNSSGSGNSSSSNVRAPVAGVKAVVATPNLKQNNPYQTPAPKPVAAPVQSKAPPKAQPFVNYTPATLQSKATPVAAPKPAQSSNFATAVVNALKSLFRR